MTHIKIEREALQTVLEAHQAMREWIDAVPDDTVLPAMPGCDRDWLDTVEANLQQSPASRPVQEPTDVWFDKCFRSDPPAAPVQEPLGYWNAVEGWVELPDEAHKPAEAKTIPKWPLKYQWVNGRGYVVWRDVFEGNMKCPLDEAIAAHAQAVFVDEGDAKEYCIFKNTTPPAHPAPVQEAVAWPVGSAEYHRSLLAMGKAMAKERAREIGDAWNQLANLLTVLEKARSATPPVQIASDDLDRNVCEELNCAEEVLDGLSVDLGMEKTDFDCIGDYIKAVFAAQAKCLTPPAPPSPEGMVLLPKRMTQAMHDVTDTEDWRWEDLLAAAEAITEGEYNELAAAQPAHLAQVVRAHIQDLRACLPTLREHKLSDTAAEVEKAANELEAAAAQPAPVPSTLPDFSPIFDGITRERQHMNKTDETLKLAKECGATTYTNRHYPEATAVTFSPLAWENFCEQALAAPTVQEPVARQYQGRDGVWNDFISEKHYKDTLADGSWPIRNLYTDPPAQPAVPLTLPPGKCASEWGGYATGPCLYTANDVMEILAAHGIAEKDD